MAETQELPGTFSVAFTRIDSRTFLLSASQVLPVKRVQVFDFFQDPRNLFEITPTG
jgi:hypothetical protein